MDKKLKYFKLFFCLFCFSVVNAQDSVYLPPVIAVDSFSSQQTEEIAEMPEQKEFGYFDSVPKVNERKIHKETLNQVRNDDDYWYANMDFRSKKKEEEPKVVVEKSIVSNSLFWILLIGGFVALLIWLLTTSNISLFRKSSSEIDEEGEEAVNENIFDRDFDKEIQVAIAAGDYRLGVRLMYLQILRVMADGGIIQYTAEKTNSDYLLQLSPTKYFKDFSALTRNFDFVWYGKFPLSAERFGQLQQHFSNFKKSIR